MLTLRWKFLLTIPSKIEIKMLHSKSFHPIPNTDRYGYDWRPLNGCRRRRMIGRSGEWRQFQSTNGKQMMPDAHCLLSIIASGNQMLMTHLTNQLANVLCAGTWLNGMIYCRNQSLIVVERAKNLIYCWQSRMSKIVLKYVPKCKNKLKQKFFIYVREKCLYSGREKSEVKSIFWTILKYLQTQRKNERIIGQCPFF